MPADLAYLAKHYLTSSNAPSSDFADRPKKRRRKDKDQPTGLIIDHDEDLSLSSKQRNGDNTEDEDVPTYDTNTKSAEFRKKKGPSGWQAVDEPSTNTSKIDSRRDEDAEAERIIAEAAEESRARRQEIDDEDAPAVVENVPQESEAAPRMQSGARAGLQTAADTAALVAEQEREERRAKKKSKHKSTDIVEQEQETIYRDATGRRIDVSLKRAEARAAAEEKVRADRKAKEDAMGDVQMREKEARKKDLEQAKFLTLGRTVDDEVMNEELKEKVRWDDPMAMYMAQQRAEKDAEERAVSGTQGKSAAGGAGEGPGRVRKKIYTGPPAAPNRYGILPGWRWDGVDRSNGFEKEWFQARSKKGRMEELSYQWQMDE